MIKKKPKGGLGVPLFQRVFGVAIVGEVLLFGAAYYTWNKLNSDRDFRKKSQLKYPWILEKYYQFGELLDSTNNIRSHDQLIWEAEANFKAKQS